jgi:hypothetical protein
MNVIGSRNVIDAALDAADGHGPKAIGARRWAIRCGLLEKSRIANKGRQMMRDFKSLHVWQAAHALTLAAYRAT